LIWLALFERTRITCGPLAALQQIVSGADRSCTRYLRRAFAEVWENQRNLADPATVAKIADEAGLSGKPGRTLRIGSAYEQNRQDALAARCFGDRIGSKCSRTR
jgi:2-hydroxychromene-2-carboxylate isomerase